MIDRLLRAHALTLVAGLVAATLFATVPHRSGAWRDTSMEPVLVSHDLSDAAARGRAIYIAEGCIHCHSQFVRPWRDDEALWGPARPLDRGQSPPLVGNRRQGPDLANVGLRRDIAWHRAHLIDPRSVVPGSRMPSYGHLFSGGDPRGSDLVAYLSRLGAGAENEHYQAIQAYRFGHDPASGDTARGSHLFGHWCTPCHGLEGRGDGPMAAVFSRPAANLRKGRPWLVSWGPGAEPLPQALARVVKFGVPGTSMPGHETLPDRAVADLVAHVLVLLGDVAGPQHGVSE